MRLWLFICLLTLMRTQKSMGLFEFTNFKCQSLDKNFLDVEYCFLRSVNRTFKYLSLKINVFQKPINDVIIKAGIVKRIKGSIPIYLNVSIDGCKFIATPPHKRNIVANNIYNIFSKNTNMNHTCPYNHDIILEKVTITAFNKQFANNFPVPSGDYIIFTQWILEGKPRCEVAVYAKYEK